MPWTEPDSEVVDVLGIINEPGTCERVAKQCETHGVE